jgi:hypothetical protein
VQLGLSEPEFYEVMNVALIVGGSIVIPHFRRAVDRFLECLKLKESGKDLNIS